MKTVIYNSRKYINWRLLFYSPKGKEKSISFASSGAVIKIKNDYFQDCSLPADFSEAGARAGGTPERRLLLPSGADRMPSARGLIIRENIVFPSF